MSAVPILLLVTHVVIGLSAAVVISLRRKPATAIAWILTIIFVPYLGVAAFFLIGFGRLPRRRREKQMEVNALMLERPVVCEHLSAQLTPDWLSSAVVLNETLGALPMLRDNSAAVVSPGALVASGALRAGNAADGCSPGRQCASLARSGLLGAVEVTERPRNRAKQHPDSSKAPQQLRGRSRQ